MTKTIEQLQQQATQLADKYDATFLITDAVLTNKVASEMADLLRQFAELGKGEELAQGLTIEQIEDCYPESGASGDEFGQIIITGAQWFHDFARAIESAVSAPLLARIAELTVVAENQQKAIELLKETAIEQAGKLAASQAKIEELQGDFQFVERWANHHAQKPTISAESALSTIQHYPPIRAITKGYKDGVIPTTQNPWADLIASQAREKEAREMLGKVLQEGTRANSELLKEAGVSVFCLSLLDDAMAVMKVPTDLTALHAHDKALIERVLAAMPTCWISLRHWMLKVADQAGKGEEL